MELTPRWRLTAGGRFDRIRNYGGATRTTDDGSPDRGRRVRSRNQHHLEPERGSGLPSVVHRLLASGGLPRLPCSDRLGAVPLLRAARRCGGRAQPRPRSRDPGRRRERTPARAQGLGRAGQPVPQRDPRPFGGFSTCRNRGRSAESSNPAASSSPMDLPGPDQRRGDDRERRRARLGLPSAAGVAFLGELPLRGR